jgi:DNA primase
MTNEEKPNDKSSPWLDADDIKSRVPIENVLSQYGLLEKLKRKGNRLVGHSPFREEKTPSFCVDTQKNIWNDFGGKPDVPGNVIGLVQALEHCSFREALVILHRDFIEKALGNQPNAQNEPTKKGATDRLTRERTENAPLGRELKGLRFDVPLLEERGIIAETAKEFGVGYCTSGMMKGRIAFPIRNVKGEIMAYAGRAVKEADELENGKYRFPPKFEKSRELFNIDRVALDAETKKAVKDFGIILVEGFTDAIKLWQEGFKNVVALMGTDFHVEQKRLLLDTQLNPTRRVTIFLDNDEAGQAGKRKIAAALIHDAFVRYVDWSRAPEGKTEPEHFNSNELAALLSVIF